MQEQLVDIACDTPRFGVFTEPTAEAAITMAGLGKTFGRTTVLRDLSLTVAPGEIFGLIGPSGSGKSTTVHLVCGHLRPDTGTIAVLGEQPTHFSATTRQRIGYMPQQFTLFSDLTVEQNIGFAAGLYGLAEWRCRDRIRAVLELVELWDERHRRTRATSGGMQRRIALAAALVHAPDLLLADEPTANLDPILRARLWMHFHERSDDGRTLLITTQYIDEAEHCDRVGLMYGGALIAEGRPEALRRQAFGGDLVDIAVAQPSSKYIQTLATIPGVRAAEEPPDRSLRVTVDDAQRAIPHLISVLEAAGAGVRSIAPHRPTFDEVFIRLIRRHQSDDAPQEVTLLQHTNTAS